MTNVKNPHQRPACSLTVTSRDLPLRRTEQGTPSPTRKSSRREASLPTLFALALNGGDDVAGRNVTVATDTHADQAGFSGPGVRRHAQDDNA